MANDRVYDELLCFLGDPIFQVPVRTFMDENCVIFDPSIDINEEHKEVHGRYKKLFDALLESFCLDVKITPEQASQGIAKMADIPDLREVFHVLFEQCQSATDFTAFCQIMVKRNIMIQEQVLRMIMEATGCLPDSLSASQQKQQQDDKQEQDLLKQVMQDSRDELAQITAEMATMRAQSEKLARKREKRQSKSEADAASMAAKKEAEMVNKTLELSKQEAAALEEERKAMEKQLSALSVEPLPAVPAAKSSVAVSSLLPGPATYAPRPKQTPTSPTPKYQSAATVTASKPKPAAVKQPSIPEPAAYAPKNPAKSSPPAAAAPAPLPAASLTSLAGAPAVSGTEAANAWLKSAQAESGQSSAHAKVAASLSQLSPDELKKRQEFLRSQRDKLLAMKKEAREKQLGAASSSQPSRPQSARAARSAMRTPAGAGGGHEEEEDEKKLQMRRAIADRLKQEVIGPEESLMSFN